eukprot:11178262-Lingulodinium_polyedra.AAC.1
MKQTSSVCCGCRAQTARAHPGTSVLDRIRCHGCGSRTATPPLGPPRVPGRAVEETTVTSARTPADQTASAFASQW